MKNKKSVAEKITKELPDFVNEVVGLSVEDLNSRVLGLAKGIQGIEDSKEEDEELESAKALVSELSGPYTEGRRVAKLKTKYLISLIKEKGGSA